LLLYLITLNDNTHPVGFLWMRDRHAAETSTWQHTTLSRNRLSRPRRDSNRQSEQASGCRPTL